jgi:branched-chain amino acid transport system ATP-binding protein
MTSQPARKATGNGSQRTAQSQPAAAPKANREPRPAPDSLLVVDDLHSWYGESHILHGMSFEVGKGEVVTLLGRNGAGKTTTMRSIMGIVGQRKGSIRFEGNETIGLTSNRIARLGIAICPEERAIFSSLNVLENLMLPPIVRPGGLEVEEIYELFPNLKERSTSQGTKLSGGEQQMLAIGRILRTGATLLLFDEPTEGLAPVIIQQIGVTLRKLKERGFTILLIEQNFLFAQTVADRFYVVDHGKVVDMIPRDQLAANLDKVHDYLGV